VQILYGDFSEGLSADAIKWSTFTFGCADEPTLSPPAVIVNDINAVADTSSTIGAAEIILTSIHASRAFSISKISATSYTDHSRAFRCVIKTPLYQAHKELGLTHYNAFRYTALGDATLTLSWATNDGVSNAAGTHALTTTYSARNRLINAVVENCSITMTSYTAGKYFSLLDFILFAKPTWQEVPG
jgi:hypothetical protein